MSLTPLQAKRIDGILKYVRFFMDKRSEHACRINPAIATVYMDLSWQQLEMLRHILSEAKGFGPDRILVVDILASEDEAKKRALFSPVDQNSILKEVVTSADDARAQSSKRTAGIIDINDIQSLYNTLNPGLKSIVELIQTWIWWDLPDAADLFCLDQQIHRLSVLATHEIDQKIEDHYRGVFNRPKGEITKAEIIQYELQVLNNIMGRLHTRLEHEQPHQVIIARRERSDDSMETLLRVCVQHIERLKHLEQVQELPPELRQHYAEYFSAPPEKITIEMARKAERDAVGQTKHQLAQLLQMGENLGEAYNFKQEYIQDVEKRCKAVMARMSRLIEPSTAAAGAAPAEQQKAGS
ncbi:MAG: hypothetical protein Kow0059_07350 [Candidatus Sumerlaeia bacterium]